MEGCLQLKPNSCIMELLWAESDQLVINLILILFIMIYGY